MPLIARALERTLIDEQSLQQRSAGCLDIVAHSISTTLLASPTPEIIEVALQFWSTMLPIVMQQLQNADHMTVTKSSLCDALSNIGVHVYERLSVSG